MGILKKLFGSTSNEKNDPVTSLSDEEQKERAIENFLHKAHRKKAARADTKVIAEGLKSNHWEVRVCALAELDVLREKAAWAAGQFAQLLGNDDEHVRILVKYRLWEMTYGQSTDGTFTEFLRQEYAKANPGTGGQDDTEKLLKDALRDAEIIQTEIKLMEAHKAAKDYILRLAKYLLS